MSHFSILPFFLFLRKIIFELCFLNIVYKVSKLGGTSLEFNFSFRRRYEAYRIFPESNKSIRESKILRVEHMPFMASEKNYIFYDKKNVLHKVQ